MRASKGFFHYTRKGHTLVDRPTQLIFISDIYQKYKSNSDVNICQQTNTKDIAGQSASHT